MSTLMEVSTLGQGACTNCVNGYTMLYSNIHHDQGYCVKSTVYPLADGRSPSLLRQFVSFNCDVYFAEVLLGWNCRSSLISLYTFCHKSGS